MKQIYVKTRAEWRNWLTHNHGKNAGIWLVSGKQQAETYRVEGDVKSAFVESSLNIGEAYVQSRLFFFYNDFVLDLRNMGSKLAILSGSDGRIGTFDI